MASLTSGEWFSKADYTECQSQTLLFRLLHLLHSFHWTVSETIQLDCACTCSVLFSHLTGFPRKLLLFISEVSVTPLFLVTCHWQLLLEVAGAPHVAGSFLFLLVSDAVDVEGTGDSVCKMSEEPSETSFS